MQGFPDFKTTVWSEIFRARDRSQEAMNSLLSRYRAPVLEFLQSRGLQAADAEDLAQEVFARIVSQDLLKKADRAKGSFRWLVLGITLLSQVLPAQDATPEQVAALLRQLDDDDADVREKATVGLMEVGRGAQAVLRKAEEGASAEALARIRRVLDYLSWDLPPPLAPMLHERIEGLAQEPAGDRVGQIATMEEELYRVPGACAVVLAAAWARETDETAGKEIANLLLQQEDGLQALVARMLSRDGWDRRRVRERLAPLIEMDVERRRRIDGALCVFLARSGLGDLATMPLADCVFDDLDHEPEARHHVAAAEALEADGAVWEAILEYRRAAFLMQRPIARLDELCEKQGCLGAHLALLMWLAQLRLPEAAKTEVDAAVKRLQDLAKKGPLPDVDLSQALRLRGWVALPYTEHRCIGERLVWAGGARPDRTQYPCITAFDRATGEIRWVYQVPSEPNTDIEMGDRRDTTLFEVGGGLLAVFEVTSRLGNGGSLGRTARRTRLTRLSPEGKPLWSREYDVNPGERLRRFSDDLVLFVGGSHVAGARAWLVSLGDGRVVSSFSMHSIPVPTGDGKVLMEGLGAGRARLFDPRTGKTVWERGYDIQAMVDDPVFAAEGEAVCATTGHDVVRIDRKDGRARWRHTFDADETTRGVAVRGEEVYVVVGTGETTWKVVRMQAADGAVKGDFEGTCGEGEERQGQCRWIGKDAFLCAGRMVDVAAGRVLHTGRPDASMLPAEIWNRSRWRIEADPADVPRAWLRFPTFAVEVNAHPSLVSVERATKVARALGAAGKEEEERALLQSVEEWDPFLPAGGK